MRKIFAMAFAVMLSGCDGPKPGEYTVTKPTNFGEIAGTGVYYFNASGGFGDSLFVFLGMHQNLRIVSIADYTQAQSTVGYWVVTKHMDYEPICKDKNGNEISCF